MVLFPHGSGDCLKFNCICDDGIQLYVHSFLLCFHDILIPMNCRVEVAVIEAQNGYNLSVIAGVENGIEFLESI